MNQMEKVCRRSCWYLSRDVKIIWFRL